MVEVVGSQALDYYKVCHSRTPSVARIECVNIGKRLPTENIPPILWPVRLSGTENRHKEDCSSTAAVCATK